MNHIIYPLFNGCFNIPLDGAPSMEETLSRFLSKI